MLSRTCWRCDTYAHMTPIAEPVQLRGEDIWGLSCVCDNCRAGSTVYLRMSYPPDVGQMVGALRDYGAKPIWQPDSLPRRGFEGVPDCISDAASEAFACFHIRSYRAAVLLARSVIEAVAKDQGITKGSLQQKIDELEQRRVIKPVSQETAHEIRLLGNDMAHGDFIAPVDQAQCDDVLTFMETILEEVYQQPARLNRYRAQRQAR